MAITLVCFSLAALVLGLLVWLSWYGNQKVLLSFWLEQKERPRNEVLPKKQPNRTVIRSQPHTQPPPPPQFIFGWSTGHSGSTTTKDAHGTARFSLREEQPRTNTRGHLIQSTLVILQKRFCFPFWTESEKLIRLGWTFGHFHNRLEHLECLAKPLKSKVAFVRIRRNRYAIARSFAAQFSSPCMVASDGPGLKPFLSYCPHSQEQNGPVSLPVPDQVWDQFSPFQRFLWQADDMDYRWHLLKQKYNISAVAAATTVNNDVESSPLFHEITWATSRELEAGIRQVGRELGCDEFVGEVPSVKRHVRHNTTNVIVPCKHLIRFDWTYRREMNFTAEQDRVLFRMQPQPLMECIESPQELAEFIPTLDNAAAGEMKNWRIIPSEESS